MEGVKFEVKYANGQYVDAAGGALSSNGIYYSDSTGKVILSEITGTVVVTELESVEGYTIDPDSQSQTVTINPNDTQTLRFYNNAVGGVELIKVSSADKAERLSGVTFEIRRVSDDALVDTVTTGRDGRGLSPSGGWRLLRIGNRERKGLQIGRCAHLLYCKRWADHPQDRD